MFSAITALDLSILHAIWDAHQPILDTIFAFITVLGNKGALWFALALALMIPKDTRLWGIGIILAIGLEGFIGSLVIKHLVARPRPFVIDPSLATTLITLPDSFSFPSGHAGSSLAAATLLICAPIKKYWLKISAAVVAIAISLSRLYVSVHYPSDVLVGALLGIVCGVLVARALRAFRKSKFSSTYIELKETQA